MFDSAVLEVAIGLFFTYTVLSLFCTAITEWIARFRARRSRSLESGIRCLLGDDAVAKDLATRFYEHPLIAGFSRPGWFDRQFRAGESQPSYIPKRDFSLVLFDLVSSRSGATGTTIAAGSPIVPLPPVAGGSSVAAGAGVDPLAAGGQPAVAAPPPAGAGAATAAMAKLRTGVDRIGDSQTGQTLRLLLQDAAASPQPSEWEAARARVEAWFDDGMARVSGQYKRGSQTIIVVVALILAIGLNVDTIDLARRLWSNEVAAVATDAEALGLTTPQDIPLGWTGASTADVDGWGGVWKAAGLLLTVVAASLGAPFWFDLLSKISNLRQHGTLPVTASDTGGV